MVCINIPRSDTNGGGGEYEVTATSEPRNHTSRRDKETDKAAPTSEKGRWFVSRFNTHGQEGKNKKAKTQE